MRGVIRGLAAVLAVFALFMPCGMRTAMGEEAEGSEELLNADFEQFDNSSLKEKVENWTAESYYYYERTDDCYNGESALKVITSTEISYANIITPNSGTIYEFGIMIKGSGGIRLKLTGSLEGGVEKEIIEGEDVSATEEWTKASVRGIFSEEIKELKISMRIEAGTIVDTATLERSELLSIRDGASVRLTGESGIKFQGKVDKAVYDEYKEKYADLEVGIIITPEDNLMLGAGNYAEFTKENLQEGYYLSIPAKKWNNEESAEEDGYYGFNCAMINIYEKNYVRKFCARTYMQYTDEEGEIKYHYGKFDAEANTRSIKEVAQKALEKGTDGYGEEAKAILKKYANAE